MLTAVEVVAARFSTGGLFRSGYDADAVDDWLDQVSATLRAYEGDPAGEIQVLAADVAHVQFPMTRCSGAYDAEQVDAMLDRVTAALAAHEASAIGGPARS